jgi:hypothetical protein
VFLLRHSWSNLRSDFQRTTQRIKRLSATIESEVELARLRLDSKKYEEVINAMEQLHTRRPETPATIHYIPFAENSRFWGRREILSRIDNALFAETSQSSLRSFALYGMGGVGKTQIALKYANSSRSKFSAIFWIAAENSITLGQSFREIAKMMCLIKPDEEADDNAVILEVKSWLSLTSESMQCVYPAVLQ